MFLTVLKLFGRDLALLQPLKKKKKTGHNHNWKFLSFINVACKIFYCSYYFLKMKLSDFRVEFLVFVCLFFLAV